MLRTGLATTKKKQFVLYAYGQKFIEELSLKGLETRNLFELSTPTTQCENMIGKCDPPNCTCWLCGLPIFINKNGNPCTRNEDIADCFYPECEHVLPVMQAFLILGGLYSARLQNMNDDFQTWLRGKLRHEYKWSHHNCNIIKTDDIFFDDNGVVDEDFIEKYLENIYSKTPLIKTLVGKQMKKDQWLTSQTRNIITTLEPILQYYRENITTLKQNLYILSSVATVLQAVNELPQILPENHKLRNFMLEFSPEVIPHYNRPFLEENPDIRGIISETFISTVKTLPIFYIIEYITVTLPTNPRSRKFIGFYNTLLQTDYSRINKISELDIKYAITNYYFIDTSTLTDLIFRISSHFQNKHLSEPYLINILYLLINCKIRIKILEIPLEHDHDHNFISLIDNKISVLKEILLNPDNKNLTIYILNFTNLTQYFPEINPQELPTIVNAINGEQIDINFGAEILMATRSIRGGYKKIINKAKKKTKHNISRNRKTQRKKRRIIKRAKYVYNENI